CGGIRGERA
nr:Chain A, HISTONE H3 PEPTIDE [synthetic construct]